MRQVRLSGLACGVLAVSFLCAPAATKAALTFEEKIVAIEGWRATYDGLIAGRPDGRYLAAYDQMFGADLATPYIESLSPHQRKRLVNVVLDASVQGSGQKYIQQLLRVMDTVLAKGEAMEWQVQAVHDLLTSRRDFQAAQRFAASTGLTIVSFSDAVRDATAQRTALYVGTQPGLWIRRELDISKGSHIVVLSLPTCPPCNEAAREIANDPELASIFRAHSLWLAPTHAPLDARSFTAWSKNHPSFETAAIYDPDEWPAAMSVETQGTPTFFFFVDGVLKHSVLGWAPQGAKARIVEPLRAMDLLRH